MASENRLSVQILTSEHQYLSGQVHPGFRRSPLTEKLIQPEQAFSAME